MAQKVVSLCALLATAILGGIEARAIIPPEVPQKRSSEIFNPFEFAAPSGDTYGADVLSAGGPFCLKYSPSFDLRLSTWPTTSAPAGANLFGYRNILRTQAGLLLSIGHGNTNVFTVEAYEASTPGRDAAIAAANAYVSAGWGAGSEIIPVQTDDGYFGVAVTGGWIQRMLNIASNQGFNPRHDIVVQEGCKTFSVALAFVNIQGLTRNYAGQTANVGISTTINPSFYNQISSAIFNNMSGVRNDAVGAYRNVAFVETFGAANSLTPLPLFFQTGFIAAPVTPPNAFQMRLYNSPRIVMSEARQDTNRDGGYATQLYYYNPYPSYPYGSGTNQYPGPVTLSGQVSASSAPIRVSLRFSEPMDSGWANFVVRLRFADGSTQNISGTWSSTVLTNDSWTGSISPSPFPDGQVTVEVRARRTLCGSGLDTSNQELDTTGSGSSSANTYDTSIGFTVDTSVPEIDPEDPPRNPLSPVVPSSHCVVGVVTSGPSGVRSVTIEGPSGFSKTTTFSCVSPSTSVAYGPHCGLAAGEYTITAVSCSSMTKSSTMTVSAVTDTLQIFASSAVGNAAAISQYLGLYGEMRIESCVVNMGSDCLWCTQSVYDQTTLQGSGSHSQFCGSHSGGAGNMCCQRLAYSGVGPKEFSIVNLGTGTASYSLSVMAQACKDNCGPNIGAVSSTMTSINAPNGGGISGHVEVAQFGRIASQSSGGICTAGSSIGGVTVTTQPCTGILNYLIQVLFPSTKCCSIVGSEVVFTSTMPISFQFEDSPGGVATDTTTLAIYQFDGAAWSSSTVTNQAVTKSTTTGVITASGEYLRSGLFGALFQPTDSSAPITTLSFQGSTRSFAGNVFVATSAYIVFSSTDPSVNGYASQLATTYYRLDATTTTAPFFAYSSSVPASLGFHILEYRAVDYAGNFESIKTSTFLVTAGHLFKTSSRMTSKGRALIGYSDSGAQLEVEARAQDALTLRISSPNAGSMLSVDNVGLVGLGEMPYGAARLDIQPQASGDIALGLRSGNSIASTSSVQAAFGYDGSTYMRHALVTTHSTGTVGNRMDFYIWNPLAPSTAAIASMDVLALQVSTNASGGVMHVRPAGNPVLGVELIVSDGSTLGGGQVIRGTAATHSARRLKSDIKDLSAAERAQAVRDLKALSHVRYNYRSEPPGAKAHTGVLFEEAPASIRGPGGTVSLDRRVLNAEASFKDAVLRLEKLQGRLKKLEEGR